MNDLGQVVGNAKLSYLGTDLRAFLYEDGSTIDLNTVLPRDSGWTLGAATGINDNGQIVGNGYYHNQIHAFLLSPVVPEPGTLCLLAFGAVLWLAYTRRSYQST